MKLVFMLLFSLNILILSNRWADGMMQDYLDRKLFLASKRLADKKDPRFSDQVWHSGYGKRNYYNRFDGQAWYSGYGKRNDAFDGQAWYSGYGR
uniref:Neuropeptide 8 n=1 Tax=Schmidtea mediterranea TaxID=79327 RepID=E3T7V1_SCHMD|nr:neuropeptide precursor 8 [Schmidtea mediterranea]